MIAPHYATFVWQHLPCRWAISSSWRQGGVFVSLERVDLHLHQSQLRSDKVAMAQNPLWHGTTGRNWIAAHSALRKSDRLWSSLAFVGIQGDSLGGLLEQRLCPACGSTLARTTTALDAVRILMKLGQINVASLDAILSAGEALQTVGRQD